MLKLAIRYLIKYRQFSIINIIGLALAISAGFVLLGFAWFESGYDNFHTDTDRIYRVLMHQESSTGGTAHYASTFSPIPKRLAEDFPEVEEYVRTYTTSSLMSYVVRNEIVSFNEDKVCFASDAFFRMFSIPILHGDQSGNLSKRDAAFISESASKKYFGTEDPIHKTITRNGSETYTVYGVYADPPLNTHLDFDFVLAYSAYAVSDPENDVDNNWSWWDTYYSYIKVADKASSVQLEAKFPDFMTKYNGETWQERGVRMYLTLQPLESIHFGLNEQAELADDVPTIRKSNLVTFILIACFILVVAWINFINLSTAQSFMRAKEVGVKKMLGSGKQRILSQFMIEALITNGVALLIGIAFTWAVLPYLITALDLHIRPGDFGNPTFLMVYGVVLLAGTLFSGYYPSLILLSHEPIKILKGNFTTSGSGTVYRNVLLVFQFSCTLFLIVSALGVFKQVVYMRNQDLGVDIEKKITFTAPIARDSLYDQRIKTFLNEVTNYSDITSYTSSSTVPGMPQEFQIGGVRRLSAPATTASHYSLSYIDEHFVDFFGLTLLAGSNLDEKIPADVDRVLINETAAKLLGYARYEEALGDRIVIPRGVVTIKGVIKDYHNQSLKSDFVPSIFRFREEGFKTHHSVSLSATAVVGDVVSRIENKWKETFAGSPFEYFEVDTRYQQQYKPETNFGSLILIFAGLAILIACMGLYSLASFNMLRQQKEMAVRKVLGAPTTSLVMTQYRKYAKLVMAAMALALPLAFYFVHQWLQVFANKIELGLDLALFPVALIISITLATVTQIILKAVRVNPVDIIRKD